jgi:maltose O-acetyltransferase
MIERLLRRLRKLPLLAYQQARIVAYRIFSSAAPELNRARFNQPVLLSGLGVIRLGKCNLGVWPSPYFLSGYIHIEARHSGAQVIIEDGAMINNNACIIADRTSIRIGKGALIGTEFTVYDSDFHSVRPEARLDGDYETAPVEIGENVFIGSRVTVLKGVSIGRNSVIAAGSVVNKDVPENVIVGGVPARVLWLIPADTR